MEKKEHNFHARLLQALTLDDEDRVAEEIRDAKAADIAEAFDLLSDENRSRLMFTLPPRTAAEVVMLLDEAVRSEVVDELDTRSLTDLVQELPPDDAADVLGELSKEAVGEILEALADEMSDQLEELLVFKEDTAGGRMTPDVVAVPSTATVEDAVEHVRHATQEEDLHEIYIVSSDRTLVGTVPLRRLVTSPPETKLDAICDSDPVVVFADENQETVLQIIRKYDAMAAAVVDAGGKLLGRITHDDLLDVAEEEAEEDLLRVAGTDASELESRSTLHAVRIRATWLLPCMVGMLFSAAAIRVSEPNFDVVLWGALILFVPMLGAMGGNSGIQTSTVIIAGFASGELGSTKLARVLAREGKIALVLAPICGVAAWAFVSLALQIFDSWFGARSTGVNPERVALAVGSAMTLAVLTAATLGIALPFSFRRLGVDPAIASGPIVTTVNDVVSVSVYMLTAFYLLN
jgi:magnesium transporter